MNLMNSGISLGRWAGIKVVLSWLFVFWAGIQIFGSKRPDIEATITIVLFGIVLLHEFGHAFACRIMKGTADHILLWPLGGLAFVAPPPNPPAWLVTTIGGPLVNVILIPVLLLLRTYADPHLPANATGAYLHIAIILGMKINVALLFFNIIPIFPLDGGRILQCILWFIVGYARSLMISGMIGTVGGIALMGLGLGLVQLNIPVPFFLQDYLGAVYPLGAEKGSPEPILIAIGAFAAFTSFQTYRRAQEMVKYRKN